MARTALSKTGDWKLEFPDDQDVRGHRVLDKTGAETNLTVDDMVVDTDQGMVDAVVFSDGTEYPARDLSIGDGVVYATTETVEGARLVSDDADFGRVTAKERRDDDADVVVVYDPDYRAHYGEAYGDSGRGYDADVVHAYRYGTESAYHDDYRARTYADAEPDLKSGYLARYGDRDYDADREAVRYGYNRARR